jgi:alpha-D-ribose 1-methylphosphonate 5-triphosphate diphosphatase PhnM
MSSFLIKDVRIFDGERTIDNGSVLVEGGKISKVSSSPIDYEGTTYSRPGHTLLPGLIDVHIHADGGNDVALPQVRLSTNPMSEAMIDACLFTRVVSPFRCNYCVRYAQRVGEHPEAPKANCRRELRRFEDNFLRSNHRPRLANADHSDAQRHSSGRSSPWCSDALLPLMPDGQSRAEMATWPKLVSPEDGRKYVQDRLKENVDYIKLMQ